MSPVETRAWSVTARVAFRLGFAYTLLHISVPDAIWSPVLPPLAEHVFGLPQFTVPQTPTGSGDRMADWLLAACRGMSAAIAAAAW